MTAADHLKRFPRARPSTIALLQKRDEKTAELRREAEAMKPRKPLLRLVLDMLKGER